MDRPSDAPGRREFRPPGDELEGDGWRPLVEIDPQTDGVSILRYMVVKDCGVMINPIIVDSQVSGGVSHGIGTLLEKFVDSSDGQPFAGIFVDYFLPTATDPPILEMHHFTMSTCRTPMGVKNMGEGGTIGAPAYALNAVNNALAHLDVELHRVSVRPAHVVAVKSLSSNRGVAL